MFIQKIIDRIKNLGKGKTCGRCRYFTLSYRNLCEKLNLAHNPISLRVRLRLGYGICVIKRKMVTRRAIACKDYEEETGT